MEDTGGARYHRRRRLLPFVAVGATALALTALGPRSEDFLVLFLPAAGCLALIFALGIFSTWERWPRAVGLPMVVVACAGIALLRESAGGGQAGFTPLLFLPVAWQAMYGRRIDLAVTVGLTTATVASPLVYLDDAGLVASQIRVTVLFAAVAAIGGFVGAEVNREREVLLSTLRRTATSDPLTGLENRAGWDALLAQEVALASRHGQPLCVALIDLDHFKSFNDEHGHLEGDALLRRIAARWLELLRTGDRLARWGGEEFALLLPATDLPDATRVLERLLAATPDVSCSAGLACNDHDPQPEALVAEADRLLYEAKQGGRARIVSALGHTSIRRNGEPPEVP